jgi:hypothetical protein
MSHNRARRDITAGIGTGAGALFAGALITLITAPTAGAEPSNPVDQAVDNLYQGIANYFSPEAMGNAVTADMFSDMFTGEGTLADQMVDNLYQGISMALQPEGPVDMFVDSMLGLSPF